MEVSAKHTTVIPPLSVEMIVLLDNFVDSVCSIRVEASVYEWALIIQTFWLQYLNTPRTQRVL